MKRPERYESIRIVIRNFCRQYVTLLKMYDFLLEMAGRSKILTVSEFSYEKKNITHAPKASSLFMAVYRLNLRQWLAPQEFK